MPYIETTDELANTIADWLGIYGCCKSDGDEGCELDKSRPFCCRMGFVDTLKDRMEQAVKNDQLLESQTPQP